MGSGDEREDLLGILRKYRPIYFAVFIVQVIAWCIGVSWWEVTLGEHDEASMTMDWAGL